MSKINKLLLAIALNAGFIYSSNAQYDPVYTHYDQNALIVNPGYAGSKRTLQANGFSRIQWAGIPGAPRFHQISAHSPINGDFAAGLSLLTGKSGPVTENQLLGDLAFHKKLSEETIFSLGIRLGLYNTVANLSQLRTTVPNDQALADADQNQYRPITGFGLYLYNPKYFVGISSPRITYNNDQLLRNTIVLQFTGGKIFELSKELALKTTAQLRFSGTLPLLADLNIHAILREKYSVGVFYRSNQTAGLMFSFELNDKFKLMYAYENGLNAIKGFTRNSHEIGLGFMIPYKDKTKSTPPRYF